MMRDLSGEGRLVRTGQWGSYFKDLEPSVTTSDVVEGRSLPFPEPRLGVVLQPR
jgi:hypothetical protein